MTKADDGADSCTVVAGDLGEEAADDGAPTDVWQGRVFVPAECFARCFHLAKQLKNTMHTKSVCYIQ